LYADLDSSWDEQEEESSMATQKAPAKKAVAKKAPAKKVVAAKAPAKQAVAAKAPGKKPPAKKPAVKLTKPKKTKAPVGIARPVALGDDGDGRGGADVIR